MSKRTSSRIFFAALLLLPLAVSCDFFRTLAGRPTSEQIEAKRIAIEKKEREHLERLDSLETAKNHLKDSLAVLDSLNAAGCVVGRRTVLPSDALEKAYYIIVGSFAQESNAAKMSSKLSDGGYGYAFIHYKNGMTLVGAGPCENLTAAYSLLCKLKDEPFCPDGTWILDNTAR